MSEVAPDQVDERYARQVLIPGWDQDRLRDARVLVVGMGALGNEVTRILALAGVGALILCDPDVIELSNLSRTGLFRDEDLGRSKAETAARALRRLAPGIEVDPRPLPLVQGVGLAELRATSLVLGCLDSRASRLQLCGRSNLVGAPMIDGGTHPWGGQVTLGLEPGGPCYGCTLTAAQRAVSDPPWSCRDRSEPTAATSPSSALVGAWMAHVAVRHLMGLSVPPGHLAIDGEAGTTRVLKAVRDPECPLHRPIRGVRAIDVTVGGTVGELTEILGSGVGAIAWHPLQEREECRSCGYQDRRFAVPRPDSACPSCGAELRVRTTRELTAAPAEASLRSLGVAPREILAVRGRDGIEWVELGSEPAKSPKE